MPSSLLNNLNRAVSEFHPYVKNFGTTANRPTVGLVAGQTYFDYTLLAWLYWDGAAWQTLSGGSIADASATVKGITKLSVAPVSPTNPIAVGDNDPRMTNARTPVGTSLTSGQVWVGSGSNIAAAVALNGDGTLSSTGALTLASVATGATVTNPSSLTFNNKGLVTAGTSGTAPVTSVTGTAPISSSGGVTPAISIAITPANPGGAVALQGTTPGTAQTGNANLTGTILAATMTATGTVQGATVNATSKVQLNGVTALEMGTSFPVSPATNQRYFRTDQLIDYVYDGTRWLSVQQFKLPFISRSAQPFAQAATVFDLNFSEYNLYGGIYIYAFNVSFFDNTAQDASNFYTLTLRYLNTSGVSSGITLGGTTDTKTFTTISRWYTLAPTFTPVAQGKHHEQGRPQIV
jgi:hypothetical protein